MIYLISDEEVIAVPKHAEDRYRSLYPEYAVKTSVEEALQEVHSYGYDYITREDLADLQPHQTFEL